MQVYMHVYWEVNAIGAWVHILAIIMCQQLECIIIIILLLLLQAHLANVCPEVIRSFTNRPELQMGLDQVTKCFEQ